MLVHTTKGLLDADSLHLKDIETWEDNARVLATEWYLGDEMVRRDVHVSMLRPLTATPEQATIGG